MFLGEQPRAVEVTCPGEKAGWMERAVYRHACILLDYSAIVMHVGVSVGAAEEARLHVVLRIGAAPINDIHQHRVGERGVDDPTVIHGIVSA